MFPTPGRRSREPKNRGSGWCARVHGVTLPTAAAHRTHGAIRSRWLISAGPGRIEPQRSGACRTWRGISFSRDCLALRSITRHVLRAVLWSSNGTGEPVSDRGKVATGAGRQSLTAEDRASSPVPETTAATTVGKPWISTTWCCSDRSCTVRDSSTRSTGTCNRRP